MATTPSRIDTIESFKTTLRETKAANAARIPQALGMPDPTEADQRAQNTGDAVAMDKQIKQANAELKDAVGELLGGSRGRYKTDLALQALCAQGDFIARVHRAKVLRNLSYVRRVAHTVHRRHSYSDPSGYVDRRVETPVIDLLSQAN